MTPPLDQAALDQAPPDQAVPAEELDTGNLPAPLPPGERILWQGRPCWKTMARRAFHLRPLALYFGVLLAWYAATALGRDSLADAALATLRIAALAIVPLALICLYAWMSSRATIYTITTRRLVMRVGIAMPVTFNLPFSRIDGADAKLWPTGHGDIAVQLRAGEHLAYLVLWPHARPRRLAHPQPTLRCIPDAERAAQILVRALAATAQMPLGATPAATPDPAGTRGPVRATQPALACPELA